MMLNEGRCGLHSESLQGMDSTRSPAMDCNGFPPPVAGPSEASATNRGRHMQSNAQQPTEFLDTFAALVAMNHATPRSLQQ